jgi:3-dehydroquinate dehydratase-1
MDRRLGIKPLIVGCVATEARLRRCARRAPADCDWIEVRLDLTGPCGGEWAGVRGGRRNGRPVLLTVRSAREGGRWRGREAERTALLLRGLDVAAAVDLEIAAPSFGRVAQAASRRGVAVVGSFHDFRAVPGAARLAAIEARGRAQGADVVKIAAQVRNAADLARLFALPARSQGPICVLGMGPLGAIARVALPAAGSCLAYGALEAATAPGQLRCRDLARELARWAVRPR